MSYIRLKTIRGQDYWYEVESERRGGEARQHVLRYLGRQVVPNVDIYTADLAEMTTLRSARKATAIICDPPYGKEYLPLYSHLARFALSNLQDNGWLVVMSGQYWLPEK